MESSIGDLPPVAADPQAPPRSSNGTHPPYAEMIVAAIAGLQDKDGSSRQAIAKYIEKEYLNLPPTHSSLLTHHLKRMKNEGELMMVKHSYMLPPPRSVPFQLPMDHYSVTATENHPARRKPGRPPKPRQDFGFQPPAEDIPPTLNQPHHLGAGAEPIFASLGLGDDGTPTPPKRGRGRPPKRKGSVVTTTTSTVSGGSGSHVEAGKRVLRRKPKLMPVTMVNGEPTTTRSVGRPKRITNTANTNTGSATRGRGRPPKTANNITNLSSQPFARSDKVESGTAVLVTDPHQLVAFQELKFKYEHLQSKAKEMLSVVRPYANSDYAVFGAVQELEKLVTDAAASSNV